MLYMYRDLISNESSKVQGQEIGGSMLSFSNVCRSCKDTDTT